MADKTLNDLKSRALEALSEDMQGNASPIKKELDMLILEAQARSVKEPAPPYEK